MEKRCEGNNWSLKRERDDQRKSDAATLALLCL